MVETYDKLAKRYPEQFEEAALAPLRRALVERRERSAGPEQNLSGEAREIAEALELRLSRVKEWDLSGKQRCKKLSRGVEQSYSRGRKAFRRAMASMDDEHFHEWRKRVKDFWYQTRLLSRVWPEMMDARARQLKWLSELLGDDHDLSMLRETLDREGETLGSGAARLSGLALQRQRELRRESEILGRRLYAMQPSCTADQLAALWKAWKPG